ncbi:GNAT family N-acetyltransferase [Pseudomonas sp. Marseille-QA0892]
MNMQNWAPAQAPSRTTMTGRFCQLEPLDVARHGDDLWMHLQGPSADTQLWDYLPYGPFPTRSAFDQWLARQCASSDPLHLAVIDNRTNCASGSLSLMNIITTHGCIEIGHVIYGPAIQRTPVATEAIYLLAREAFRLGNRRLEWKCNAENARSKAAAERFGFSYEGTFRQHMIIKGRNRDTAWYAMLDSEWPHARLAFEAWLSPANFDERRMQKRPLAARR